jgi:hypothetical protein
MLKFFLLFTLLLTSLLDARENPFFPVDSAQDIPVTSNQIQNIPPLKRVSIELPSTARVLESVTIKYKNLDGSIATKTTELEHSVDWHLPLFVSQNYCTQETKVPTKSSVKTKKSIAKRYTEILKLPFIRFDVLGKKLRVVTQDKLLRHFLLVKPHRIVCDFKRDTDIRSYVKDAPKGSLFKRIRIGTHKGYYRVVIELDGYYTYSMKKIAKGYLFTLY